MKDTVVIRGNLPNKDLGYPSSIALGDEVFTAGIEATRWRV